MDLSCHSRLFFVVQLHIYILHFASAYKLTCIAIIWYDIYSALGKNSSLYVNQFWISILNQLIFIRAFFILFLQLDHLFHSLIWAIVEELWWVLMMVPVLLSTYHHLSHLENLQCLQPMLVLFIFLPLLIACERNRKWQMPQCNP